MSNEKYQPYRPVDAHKDGNNTVEANEGAGSTQPYVPNGWNGNFEEDTFKEKP